MVTLCGIVLFLFGSAGTVEQVHVTRKGTFIELPRLRNPSYYILLRTLEGPLLLDVKRGIPIGNGLAWPLQHRIDLNRIYEIELYDRRFLGDKLVDRVAIRGRRAGGQGFEFELQGSRASQSVIAAAICIIGILAMIGALTAMVVHRGSVTLRRQAVQG